MRAITRSIEQYFLPLVVVFSLCGYFFPDAFKGLVHSIPMFLGIIMFGMGITLQPDDFMHVAKFPRALVAGVVAQYAIMPLIAFVLTILLPLPSEIVAGLILVGSCPGGTASNVITYLAGGNVALSVAMTTASTLLSPIFTPLFTYLYAGRWVSVPVFSMFISIVKVIIIPVALGVVTRIFFKNTVERIIFILPSVSVMAIVTIIAGITAANAHTLHAVGALTVVAVILHNGAGLVLGYVASLVMHFDEKERRTIAIEVGMQNSGLAVSLAVMHFTALAALPGAIFSIWHNISGSIAAWWWKQRK
ncbi:MAG: bile acid:sodium symporter family protein [Spirochaetes bacterium]|nr:bile acid:sodium symporter family protein [Spirochaetota bacterium]